MSKGLQTEMIRYIIFMIDWIPRECLVWTTTYLVSIVEMDMKIVYR